MKKLSVFLPVYDEENILIPNTVRLITYLDANQSNYEIIIGSNGSRDRTPALSRMLSERYNQVVSFHLKEKGVGDAFKHGVQIARGRIIVSLDMDLSANLSFIERAVELLDADYDIVVGSKKMGHESRSVFRKLGSDLFILMARMLMGLPFEDYSIGAKAYKRDLLLSNIDRIDRGTSYVLNIIQAACRNGKKVIEIPVRCEDHRQSKFNIVREGLYRFAMLFRLWYVEKACRGDS